MIITKIEITDFMCYAGNDNIFDFTEGLNIIIGDNGYGKSKLFDAFYWVLYDSIYVPEIKKFLPTESKEIGINLISDKAKYDSIDGSVKALVKITFHNIENDSVYIWEREYRATKQGSDWISDRKSIETIWKKELSYLNAKVVELEYDKDRIRKQILPETIKPYMWFQGEQVETMIDFKDSETLTTAINILSDISRFDRYVETTTYLYLSANKEYTKNLTELSKDKDKSIVLESEKNKLDEDIIRLENENEIVEANYAKAENDCTDLLSKINEAQDVNKFQAKKDALNEKFEEIESDYKKSEIGFHKKMFKEFWILKGTEHFIDKYSEKYHQYNELHYEIINEFKRKYEHEHEILKKLQTRLPFNVPDDMYIDEMLKKEKCLVCDREAKENSDAWLKIKELKDRKEESLKVQNKQPFKNNFEYEFTELLHNARTLRIKINNTDESINEALQFREDYKIKRDETNAKIKALNEQIEQLLHDSSLKSASQAKNIVNEYTRKKDDSYRYQQKIENNKKSIENKRYRINEILLELSKNSNKPVPENLQEKVNILHDLKSIAISTRKRVYKQLIEKLEKEMNIHYKNMTAGLNSYRGNLKLVERSKDNYVPQIQNEEGYQDTLLNTSNLMLIKLATIMAIITAKKDARSTDLYTLITDAPLSTFGDSYILGFCKTVSSVYRQSIVMSKEFYHNEALKEQLLKEPDIKLGKVYILTPSLKEKERSNRNNLSTIIKPIN